MQLSQTLVEAAGRWRADLGELRQHLQHAIGEDRVFIEDVKLANVGESPRVRLRMRYPSDGDEGALGRELTRAAEA